MCYTLLLDILILILTSPPSFTPSSSIWSTLSSHLTTSLTRLSSFTFIQQEELIRLVNSYTLLWGLILPSSSLLHIIYLLGLIFEHCLQTKCYDLAYRL